MYAAAPAKETPQITLAADAFDFSPATLQAPAEPEKKEEEKKEEKKEDPDEKVEKAKAKKAAKKACW